LFSENRCAGKEYSKGATGLAGALYSMALRLKCLTRREEQLTPVVCAD